MLNFQGVVNQKVGDGWPSYVLCETLGAPPKNVSVSTVDRNLWSQTYLIEQWKKYTPGCLGCFGGMKSYPLLYGDFIFSHKDPYKQTSISTESRSGFFFS